MSYILQRARCSIPSLFKSNTNDSTGVNVLFVFLVRLDYYVLRGYDAWGSGIFYYASIMIIKLFI